MANVAPLLQLMWHHFVWANASSSSGSGSGGGSRCVVICYCWPRGAQLEFARLAMERKFYARYVNLTPHNGKYNNASNDNSGIAENFAVEYLRHHRSRIGVFLDWQCGENAKSVVHAAADVGFLSDRFSWLIYDGSGDLQQFRQHFELINLGVNTQLTYVMPSKGGEKRFILYDVYNNGWHLGGQLNTTIDRELSCNRTGCQLTRFLSTLHERSKYGQRERLSDIQLRVALVIVSMPVNTPEERIIAYMNTENHTEIDLLQRLAFRMLLMLQDMLVTKMDYHFVDKWSGGELVGGCVGVLVNQSVDLCGSPFTVTKVRLTMTRPLVEGCSFRPICMFRTPRNPAGIEARVILAPFTPPVWHFFGFLLLLAAVLLWFAFRVEQRFQRFQHFVPSLLTTCLLAIGTACVQGSPMIPRSFGGRMIFFMLVLICYLTYNYYTSAVVSTLLGAPVKSKIKTLTQLADSNLPVGLEPVIHNIVYFNTSPLADVRHFAQRKITSSRSWMPLKEGILRVRDEPGFVYVFEASGSYILVERYYEQHQICDLNEFPYRPEKSLYTHVRHNSSYKEIIHLKQLRTIETGVFDKHRRYWQRRKLNCYANKILIDVGFEYTAPLFIMLVCAYIVSTLVLLLELFLHKKCTDRKSKATMPASE